MTKRGEMPETVLFVDDEKNVLNSLDRLFGDSGLRLLMASDAQEALSHLKNEDVSVMVTDNLMPGMMGIDLLAQTRFISPETVKVLMTAHANLNTAIEAINRGEIFRFVIKPWENDEFKAIVEDSLNRYRIVQSLLEGDEAKILALGQMIELKDPYTKGHCDRVARYALGIADELKLDEQVKREIKLGSWLHDCGKVGVPEKILNFKGALSNRDFDIVKNHPYWGAEVARQARLSKEVVNVTLHHHERFDGKGYPFGLKGEEIPLEARMVAVADVYDALTTDRPYRNRIPAERAAEIIAEGKNKAFDPEIAEVFLDLLKRKGAA